MPNQNNSSTNYFLMNKVHYLNIFKEYLRLPSISADSKHKVDIERTAKWLTEYLQSIGIEKTEIFHTNLHPIVYGENLKAGIQKPTVLIYGHYDVQPIDPIKEWQTDPFSPTEKNGYLYARGASDMKGQLMVSLAAIDSIQKTSNLPLNIKFILEGEEEIGSPSIVEFLTNNRELLASDFALNLDAGMIAKDKPTIVYGLRGLVYFEIHITGPAYDLHSGLFGGVVYNPIQALCELLAGMKDQDGKILLPNFYKNVLPLSKEERLQLNELPIADQYYLDQTGVKELYGEKGYTAVEQVGVRPTLDINGIISGYTGEGPKTVIPSHAMAKISCRLVPNQSPDEIHSDLLEYMKRNAPSNIQWEVKKLTGDFPCIIDPNLPATKSFRNSLARVFNTKPLFKREGGSIPVVSYMKSILGIESVLSGFGLPEDHIHSPNERIDMELWDKGVMTLIDYFTSLDKKDKE
jgi:acetylornithine deacetylase/succinyl-diaminopimelate desuccinylase-like protein